MLLIGTVSGRVDEAVSSTRRIAVYIVDPSTDTVSGVLPGARHRSSGIRPPSSSDPDRNELFVWEQSSRLRVFDSNLDIVARMQLAEYPTGARASLQQARFILGRAMYGMP